MRTKILVFAVGLLMALMLACGDEVDYGPDGYSPKNTPVPKATIVIVK